MQYMSAQRLGGVPILTKALLTSGSEDSEVLNRTVSLHLYEVELHETPKLNPQYYVDSAWLSPDGYEDRCADQVCGLCLRLWADYAWMAGIAPRPFVPRRVASSG
jgi:hypothetical protein